MLTHSGPALTVDAIISYPDDRVVLIRRGIPPFRGMWALPGGFVELGETVEQACIREVMEECLIKVELTGLQGVYSDPKRDPRGHTVSIIFCADYKSGELKGSDDASEAKLFSRKELKAISLAFDHGDVLREAGWL